MRGIATTSARALIFAMAFALGAAGAPTASLAAPLKPSAVRTFHYNTLGTVNASSAPLTVSGPAQLRFEGVDGGTFYPGSGQAMNIGQFVLNSTIPGVATQFVGTPFRVQVRVPELDKTTKVPVLSSVFSRFGKALGVKTVTENSLILRGHLDGTVGADGRTDLKATVRSVKLGSLDPSTSEHVTKYTFPIRFGELKLPPNWAMADSAQPRASAQEVLATPAPEPASVLVFGATLGGLALARRLKGTPRPAG